MIKVQIWINKRCILEETAVRIKGNKGENCSYRLSDGRIITHDFDEGAKALSRRIIDAGKISEEGIK